MKGWAEGMGWRECSSKWENKSSKIGDKESGWVLVVLMDYWLLSSLWLLLLIGTIEKLGSVEVVFLSRTHKAFYLGFIILPWEIDIDQFPLLQVRLTNLAFCCSSTIPSPFGLLVLFRYCMSIEVLLICDSFIRTIYIYFLELADLFVDITDLKYTIAMLHSFSLRAKALLLMIAGFSVTGLGLDSNLHRILFILGIILMFL